jgi:hypothetical protein
MNTVVKLKESLTSEYDFKVTKTRNFLKLVKEDSSDMKGAIRKLSDRDYDSEIKESTRSNFRERSLINSKASLET